MIDDAHHKALVEIRHLKSSAREVEWQQKYAAALEKINLLAKQLQLSAYREKDYQRALMLLACWNGKFNVANPFPCGECGRKSVNDEPLVYTAKLENGITQIVGCTMCNVYALVHETTQFLNDERD